MMGINSDDMEKYEEVIQELEKEWSEHYDIHINMRTKRYYGIRSSQLSALVMYLIKKGVL